MANTEPTPGASLGIPTVPNLRDLGGWSTPNGTVRRGLVFRSAEFAGLQGEDLEAFNRLGIATVYDLRTETERAAQPNTLPEDVRYVPLDVLKDSKSQAPALLLKLVGDPKAAEQLLGGSKALELFQGAYREFIDLPSAKAGYHQFFSELADGDHLPALFHCTTGKDRTGWAAAATLLLLGVSEDDVMTDFTNTNEQLAAAVQPVLDKFAAIGGNPDLLSPVLQVRPAYLQAAMTEMTDRYGDIETYMTQGLGLTGDTIDKLRSALIAPSAGAVTA